MSIFLLVLGILSIIALIALHELGHFWVARRNGVEVEEYGLFFPPRLYSRKTKSGWIFSINAIPLGGFVRLKGERDIDTEPHSYGASTLRVKTKILLAGVTTNFIIGLILFTFVALAGMPHFVPNQYTVASDTHAVQKPVSVNDVVSGSPADTSGLKSGDVLTSFNVYNSSKIIYVNSNTDIPSVTRSLAGKKVTIHFSRGGVSHMSTVRFLSLNGDSNSKNKYALGISTSVQETLYRSTWSAPIVAFGLSMQLIWMTIVALGHSLVGLVGLISGLLTNNHIARQHAQVAATANIAGPVGIIAILHNISYAGFLYVMWFIAYISIILAFMNILPIPVVDGGKLYLTFFSRSIKWPLTEKRENAIYGVTAIILIILAILITINDIKRIT
jgi:regulator of sigma E protease